MRVTVVRAGALRKGCVVAVAALRVLWARTRFARVPAPGAAVPPKWAAAPQGRSQPVDTEGKTGFTHKE
jgi:hypothetical protein